VGAGEAWPVGCAARKPVIVVVPSAASSDAIRSDLVEQNRMFVAATAARRQGDIQGAVGLYERFVATYPSSALAESAAVERMRLLATSDPVRARAAATEYLARHPKGFARDEAVSISSKHP